jgi:NADH-quinone oxidoreductase subunit A
VPDQAANDFLPILLLLGFAVTLAGVMLALSALLGKRGTKNPAKDSAFECGMVPLTPERRRFAVKFSTVAMLFILFDIEVIFVLPWAILFQELGLFGFVEMLVFIGVLVIGWWYAVAKGAFDWSSARAREFARAPAAPPPAPPATATAPATEAGAQS